MTKFTKWNKSFSYKDTAPLHSLLVCILNFDNKTSNIFSKCNNLFGRYWEKHILYINKGLVVLRLNVPVNNFSVMSGRSHRFLGN